MTVKTGQTWAGAFVTLDATGASSAADSAPTGALYVDGVSNAASVTITGSNPYKFAVTLPTLTAGQRVDMYITATIDTIATAGIVASAQADTVLVSDIVGADSDTLETLSDQLDAAATASALSTLDGKVDTIDNYIDTEIAAIITHLTDIKGAGWSTETLKVIRDALTAVQADLDNPAQYKADVSGLATAAALTTVDNEVGVIDGIVDAIKLKTDNLPADPADDSDIDAQLAAIKAETASILEDTGTTIPATITTIDNEIAIIDGNVDAILDDTGTSGVLLSTSALTSIFDDEVIVGSYNFSDLLKIMASALAGKLSGGGTTTLTFRGVDDTSDVIVATVDANGNRSALTLTV